MTKNTPKIARILIAGLLLLSVLIVGFPFLYAFAGSFKSSVEFLAGNSGVFPTEWRWQNYIDAWNMADFNVYTLNSMFFSVGTIFGTLATCTMSGFVLSRSKLKINKILQGSFAITLFVSGAITLFPIFKLCNALGLTSSLWGLVIAQVAISQPVYCMLTLGYINGIPREIDEAAKIDGCSFFRTYWNIILPVIKPIMATVSILSFRDAWNNFMMPLAFTLSTPRLRTLTVGVVQLKDQGEGISSWNLMIAGTMISLVPMMVVYLFLNRYFISGIMEGSVKG